MFSKQKICKISLILALVALISLIPTSTFKVFADETIVPPFPYDELQTIGENQYVLFKVHGVDQVDYIECLIPGKGLHGAFSSVLPGLSYSPLGGWVLQINSIDYYFKDGKKVYFDMQSLFSTSFMPINNDDNYFPAWLEFVYCTSDIWGLDEDEISGYNIIFFKSQNFIIEPAATPTPSPEISPSPQPFYFPDVENAYYTVSTYYTSNKLLLMRFYSESEQKYMIKYFTLFSEKNRSNQLKCFPLVTSVSENNGTVRVDLLNEIVGGYSPRYNYFINESDNVTYFDSLQQIKNTVVDLSNHNIELRSTTLISGDSYYFDYLPGGDYYFEDAVFGIINSDGTVTFDSGGGSSNPTPTPTSPPTPIPQPSTTPAPDDDKPGWGWGIVNALKYIFIPDKNKLIRLEKTTQTKFQQFGGGYDDLKHVSGFEDPVRPQNVVMNWQPFGSDSVEDQQQITLVDFEQIDFYLFQTSSGMFICECLKASFTFLMFGYLIHVIRKHFVIENNTSEESDGGGD